MKKRDDYISGPHSYWFHFIAGLALGVFLGWWFFGDISDHAFVNLLAVGVTAVCFAFFCGRWGEPAWRRVSDWLAWWFGTLR